MATATMNAVCSQLLTKNDLTISDKFIEKIDKEQIVSSILENNDLRSIKIFSKKKLYLSEIIPILHDMGFNIIDEVTYSIEKNKQEYYINRFNLQLEDISQIQVAQENIEAVLTNTLKHDNMHNCKLFALIYLQNFSFRHITLLRALIEYLDQAVLSLNRSTIVNTIIHYDKITDMFVDYFQIKFSPNFSNKENKLQNIEQRIEESIKVIPEIIDDKILKLMLKLLKNILRTNYFLNKESIAFKINTKEFASSLKGLQPNLENFVYDSEFYGIHLRMSKVSRGGLRWSDRHEDYRQEIKSLMITQEGKNSIIIPDGAKGGFVIKREKTKITKDYFEEIYTKFIENMLDLVDNRKDGEIIKLKNIVCYDDDDPYFVVAADKGTAFMSDVANAISIKRGYWLGDAFASGGSNGYGHKDLGITARGAIMSTKRFFIEEGVDIYKDEISVVGLGSMNGDVFGNGMLESDKFKLLAAIGHKEIFIDPTPNTKLAFDERNRLFSLKNSSWKAYDKSLISKGGGVFLRSEKAILLSEEIKNLLHCQEDYLSGEELCKKILCLNVDLLFNGGVGTYVKASDENSFDIGDKQNEAVRVDASTLRAKVVCEGGNLGFTQKARIEYALCGGKINIDGIDNSGGVDTSDREVNLKILLNSIVSNKILNKKEASSTLQSLTSQVVESVLLNNYNQSLVISRDERLSRVYLNDFLNTIEILENDLDFFNRRDFYIPKNENIKDVQDIDGYIVRPVLCSILSYTKIFVKKMLLKSDFIEEVFCLKYLFKYFPKSFVGAYEHEILTHPLKKEIIATQIADLVINAQGATFISDFKKLGFEKFILKIKSYLILNELFSGKEVREKIYLQDYSMNYELQYKLLNKLEYTLYSSTRWMVKYLKKNEIDATHILDHKDELFEYLSQIHSQTPKNLIEDDVEFNQFFTVIDYLRFAIAAIMIKEKTHHSFKDVVVIFYLLIHEFSILELILALNKVKIVSKNDMVLRNQVLQFIEFVVVDYTQKILEFQRLNEEPKEAFKNYVKNEHEVLYSIKSHLDKFVSKENKDIKEIAIAVNQIMVSLI